MSSRNILTLAALGASVLLPVSGAFAADDAASSASTTNTIMDAAQFRDSLHNLRDVLTQIRENQRLSLAAQDPLLIGQFEQNNRILLNKALGIADTVSLNWKHADIPSLPEETAEVRSNKSLERMGTADAQRFANESEDTAVVRNAVWDIQSQLHADKLNGRDPVVTGELMGMLDAAIQRAENPSFHVVKALDQSRLAQITWPERKEFVWDRSHDMVATNTPPPAPAPSTTETTTTTETATNTPPPAPEKTQVAENPPTTTSEESTTTESTERTGAANLPKTGGDPGSLIFLGSGLAGLGAFLRRRRS
jgi:LPXTG-motif cell wall-anchored protein